MAQATPTAHLTTGRQRKVIGNLSALKPKPNKAQTHPPPNTAGVCAALDLGLLAGYYGGDDQRAGQGEYVELVLHAEGKLGGVEAELQPGLFVV